MTRDCPENRDQGKQRELGGCRFKRRGGAGGVGKEIGTERTERPQDGEQQETCNCQQAAFGAFISLPSHAFDQNTPERARRERR
jgi:hypothetical protein